MKLLKQNSKKSKKKSRKNKCKKIHHSNYQQLNSYQRKQLNNYFHYVTKNLTEEQLLNKLYPSNEITVMEFLYMAVLICFLGPGIRIKQGKIA